VSSRGKKTEPACWFVYRFKVLGLETGIFLWESGIPGEVAPLTPEALADRHPLWAEDVAALGPWSKVTDKTLVPGQEQILWRSDGSEQGPGVLICGSCPSSMDLAWRLEAKNALSDWCSILAVEQLSGRGQWRRQWVSPPGNLYVSWRWPQNISHFGPANGPSSLSLVVGYILAHALETLDVPVEIKWPNDILWMGRKVGGILIEQRNKRCQVGIGLNLVSAPADRIMELEGSARAASFQEAGLAMSPLRGWLEISRLARACLEDRILGAPADVLHGLLESRLAGIGRTVMVHQGEQDPFKARLTGLSPDGGLSLERNGSRFVLYSGRIRWE
jgi:BirA family biotin operon repressor/biotin-[acetyl-CoA-carboxylase] ligase